MGAVAKNVCRACSAPLYVFPFPSIALLEGLVSPSSRETAWSKGTAWFGEAGLSALTWKWSRAFSLGWNSWVSDSTSVAATLNTDPDTSTPNLLPITYTHSHRHPHTRLAQAYTLSSRLMHCAKLLHTSTRFNVTFYTFAFAQPSCIQIYAKVACKTIKPCVCVCKNTMCLCVCTHNVCVCVYTVSVCMHTLEVSMSRLTVTAQPLTLLSFNDSLAFHAAMREPKTISARPDPNRPLPLYPPRPCPPNTRID